MDQIAGKDADLQHDPHLGVNTALPSTRNPYRRLGPHSIGSLPANFRLIRACHRQASTEAMPGLLRAAGQATLVTTNAQDSGSATQTVEGYLPASSSNQARTASASARASAKSAGPTRRGIPKSMNRWRSSSSVSSRELAALPRLICSS